MTASVRCKICNTDTNKHPTAHLCGQCVDDLLDAGVWLCTASVHEGDRILPVEKFGQRKHRRYPMMQCLECEHIRDRARAAQARQDTRDRRLLNDWGPVLVWGPGLAGMAGGCHKCTYHGLCVAEVANRLPMLCEPIRGYDVIEAALVDPARLMGTNFLARLAAVAPDVLPHLIDHDTIEIHTRSLQNA